MAMTDKIKTVYICSQCGFESPKWAGKCPQCNEWNTMNEEIKRSLKTAPISNTVVSKAVSVTPLTAVDADSEFRFVTTVCELDRVLGGGIVKGSGILLSGDPGIGKSTLLMQICGILAEKHKILYVSGEESSKQLRLRSQRLNVNSDNINIMIETDVENISSYIYGEKPDLVMIDSIQTMSFSQLNSSPGSITQVRECTNILLRAGKSMDIPVIIVGHVNKDGAIAGPKVMEHIVDAVLYFEGERNYSYRILRAIKNRYGSTNEIGVFEMTDEGLKEVHSPSVALLSGRLNGVSGNCIACVIEGSRPILAEVQALVASTSFGNPRRMTTGFDYNRLNMLLAILEKRLGLLYSNLDAYLNIIGGLKLDEPASDLAVALALVSSLKDRPLPAELVAFGEIGLAGEIRSVPRILSRINELSRLGFNKCVIPYYNFKQIKDKAPQGVELIGVKSIAEAVRCFF